MSSVVIGQCAVLEGGCEPLFGSSPLIASRPPDNNHCAPNPNEARKNENN